MPWLYVVVFVPCFEGAEDVFALMMFHSPRPCERDAANSH